MTAARTIALAAGGTGGHVFPARALAEVLSLRGWRIALVTDERGASFADAVANSETHRIKAASLGGGACSKLKGLTLLGVGLLQALTLLRRLRPAVTVGFGGYASVPTVWAAQRAGLPTLLHEQNAVLGRANRLLAGGARRIATSFETVSGIRPRDAAKCTLTGNPVRAEISAIADTPYNAPVAGGRLHLLVFGGSQGARIFSEIVPAAIAALDADSRRRLHIVQQCRPEDLEAARATYDDSAVDATLAPFFDDMPARFADAHLVIARSGASTVAEIAAAGRPAILVPYRFAMDDHQTANAQAVEQAGGGWVMREQDFTAPALSQRLNDLLDAPERLGERAARVHTASHRDAAVRLADAVEAIAAPANDNGVSSGEEAAA